MLSKVSVPVGPEMTQGELHDILKEKGARLLLDTIPRLVEGSIQAVPQPEEEATYASLITRDMEKLDWSRTAEGLHDQIRAFDPWPGSFTLLPDGKRLKVWKSRVLEICSQEVPGTVLQADSKGFRVACGKGSLEILECQPEGKKRMAAAPFVNGKHVKPGDRLA